MDIKKAQKKGYRIFREVRYFAKSPDGIVFSLYPDWRYEDAFDWRKRPTKKKQRTRKEGGR